MPKASPSPHPGTPIRTRLIIPSGPPPLAPKSRLGSSSLRYAKEVTAGLPCASTGIKSMSLEVTLGIPLGTAVSGNGNSTQGGRSDASNASTLHRSHGPSPVAMLQKSNRKLVAEMDSLKLKIQSLERSQGRYRQRVQAKTESLKDIKVELEEARNQAVAMEEKVDEMQELVRCLERYKGWWLTEYYSLQALLGLIPDRRDVEAIASSANDRFRLYYATL